MEHKTVRNKPVAKFFYKGSHSHPVRRTVLIIESNDKYLRGYEVREGNKVRQLWECPIKTFTKKNIATTSSLRKDNKMRSSKDKSTLSRISIREMEQAGV